MMLGRIRDSIALRALCGHAKHTIRIARHYVRRSKTLCRVVATANGSSLMVQDAAPTAPKRRSRISRLRRVLLLIGGPLLVLVGALYFYLTGGRYVSTDDAYVQTARVEVSTDVSGRIAEIEARDNQYVHKG